MTEAYRDRIVSAYAKLGLATSAISGNLSYKFSVLWGAPDTWATVALSILISACVGYTTGRLIGIWQTRDIIAFD